MGNAQFSSKTNKVERRSVSPPIYPLLWPGYTRMYCTYRASLTRYSSYDTRVISWYFCRTYSRYGYKSDKLMCPSTRIASWNTLTVVRYLIQGLAHRHVVVCTCTYYNSEVEILRNSGGDLGSSLESDLIKSHMLTLVVLTRNFVLYIRVICGDEKEYRNQLERKNGIEWG